MSGLHLNHKISWNNALNIFTSPKDPGVELTICGYQKIHIIDKDTKIKVKNRKYLLSQICNNNSNCHEITGKKRFYKNTKNIE
jgi:hypothetical protein